MGAGMPWLARWPGGCSCHLSRDAVHLVERRPFERWLVVLRGSCRHAPAGGAGEHGRTSHWRRATVHVSRSSEPPSRRWTGTPSERWRWCGDGSRKLRGDVTGSRWSRGTSWPGWRSAPSTYTLRWGSAWCECGSVGQPSGTEPCSGAPSGAPPVGPATTVGISLVSRGRATSCARHARSPGVRGSSHPGSPRWT